MRLSHLLILFFHTKGRFRAANRPRKPEKLMARTLASNGQYY